MSDYSKSTNFATKDSLLTGDPLKVIKGTEIDDEFEALETSISTKADLASPTFTGTPKAPTAAAGTNTTQLATTAFVGTAISNYTIPNDSVTSAMLQENSVTTRELNVAAAGTSGQVLISDGDGSFSWYSLPGASSNPFLSPAASDPTQRDDASALQEGDIYYNTADDELKTYDGSAWNSIVATYPYPNSSGVVPVGGFVIANYSTGVLTNNTPSTMPSGGWMPGFQFTLSSSAAYKLASYGVQYDNTGQGFISLYNAPSSTWNFYDYGTWVLLGGSGNTTTAATSMEGGAMIMRVA